MAQRRPCKRWNVRTLLVATVFLSLFIAFFGPQQQHQQQVAEGAKLKKEAKKLIKSLAKGFVVSKLTTRKNFMPLPVPIPGKWQQILTAAFDSGLLGNQQQQKQKFNPGSSKKYGSASSIGTDSISVSKFLASKLFNAALGSASGSLGSSHSGASGLTLKNSASESAGGKSFNLKRIEKQVRITAAKYAGKIIAQQLPNKSSLLPSGTAVSSVSVMHSAAASSPSGNKFAKRLFSGFLTDRKSAASDVSSSAAAAGQQHSNKQNDLLVTVYNLVKFLQQFRELDRTKLLDLNKMSLSSLIAATNPTNNKVPPIIAMNINNKKTLMNKLNYIHNLSSTVNRGHRRDHHLASVVV